MMPVKKLPISLLRYNQLRSESWPDYQLYLHQNFSNEEIAHFEYRFKHGINNADLLDDETYSQAHQEMFVIAMTQGKKQGIWLEYGANPPIIGSNTHKLEKQLQWSGISVDIKPPPQEECDIWQQRNRSTFVLSDAIDFDLPDFPKRYDYLSMDIDDLKQVPLLDRLTKKYRFSVITYETDWFRLDDVSHRQTMESRQILLDRGYVLVVNGVTIFPNLVTSIDNRPLIFEDWWVDPQAVDERVIESYRWITEDSLDIQKYWVEILFENDPHLLKKNQGIAPPSNQQDIIQLDYQNMAGTDWPSFSDFLAKKWANLPATVINELENFIKVNKL